MCKASDKLQMTLDAIVIACDKLGECIATAHDSATVEESGVLDPFLALWRVRWELGLHGGDIEGAEPKERERIAACDHESANDTEAVEADGAQAES